MEIRLKSGSQYFLISILTFLSIYILFLARKLIIPFITAAIMTTLCMPIYKRLKKKIKREKLCAFLTVLILAFVILIPLTFLFTGLVSEGIDLYKDIRDISTEDFVKNTQEKITDMTGIELDDQTTQNSLKQSLTNIRNGIWKGVQFITANITGALIDVVFTLFFMFYLLVHGRKIYKYVEVIIPIKRDSKNMLKKEIVKNIQALFYGQGLVALVQGVVGWLGFLIFGVENALFWGFVMGVLSFIPIIGAWLVWIPISIVLIIQGNYVSGIWLLVWGVVLVSNIDNVLRPFLVSSFSKIHFLVVLVGVYIGVQAFNLIGVILGPLIITIGISFAKIYYNDHIANIPHKIEEQEELNE